MITWREFLLIWATAATVGTVITESICGYWTMAAWFAVPAVIFAALFGRHVMRLRRHG